jgi:hypothetical protein
MEIGRKKKADRDAIINKARELTEVSE